MENKKEDITSGEKVDFQPLGDLAKDPNNLNRLISEAIPDIKKVMEPFQNQLKTIEIYKLPKNISIFSKEQREIFGLTQKTLNFKMPAIPKTTSIFSKEQREIFGLTQKTLNFKMPAIPKTASIFSKEQREIFGLTQKTLNFKMPAIPKTTSIFSKEQRKMLESLGKGLNLTIKDLPQTASFFSPIHGEMLKSIVKGLNSETTAATRNSSSIVIDDFIPYWEDESVQEIIDHEISNVEEAKDTKKLIDYLNHWTSIIIDYPANLREKSPFVYMILIILLSVFGTLAGITFIPGIGDVVKDIIWDSPTGNEENPKKHAKTLKQNVIMQYPEAEQALNSVRVTNRETEVYRSDKKTSGRVDTIQPNKPVIIMYKKKSWSLVLYKNKDNQEVNGWVFTKNLIK